GRQLQENGIPDGVLHVSESAITEIIRTHTREAGVRNLERELGSVCRAVARRVAAGQNGSIAIREENLAEVLGPARFRWELASEAGEVGVATGLAAPMAGRDVRFGGGTPVPGTGRLILAGKAGEVVPESAQ